MAVTRDDAIGSNPSAVAQAKAALRQEVLAARARLSLDQLAGAASAITSAVLSMPEVISARCVASYVSVGREPGTRGLLDTLVERGVLVLAPVLLADGDLDWAEYDGAGALEPAARGLLEPTGPRLGVDAIRRADVVVVPALAVDQAGNRLGRGGGSYDRALARVSSTTTVAMLYDREVVTAGGAVPATSLDRPVSAVATPSSIHRVRTRHLN